MIKNYRNLVTPISFFSQNPNFVTPPISFVPTDVANLTFWYAADNISGVTTDNTGVSSWTDLSGNSKHMVQATSGSRPTFKTNIKNGKPCVRFDATSDFVLATTSTAFTSGSTAFFVINPSGSAVPAGSWLSMNTGTGTGEDYETGGILLGHASSATQIIAYWNGSRPGAATDASINSINLYTFEVSSSGANITQIWTRNGTNLKNYTAAGTGNITAVRHGSGGRLLNNGGNMSGGYGKFDIFEIVVYSRPISAANITSVQNYLNSKYAIY